MTRNQTKIASATAVSTATNPISNTSNDPLIIDNNHAIIYPNMFDRWSLPL